jgi:hypothetical protein
LTPNKVMNIKKYILGSSIILILIFIGFLSRRDKVIDSATSESGEKRAILFQTNDGLFGNKYCLRIITVKTGISFEQDEPQLNTIREVDVQNTKLNWKSDIKLEIEFGNGLTQIILLNEVRQPQ